MTIFTSEQSRALGNKLARPRTMVLAHRAKAGSRRNGYLIKNEALSSFDAAQAGDGGIHPILLLTETLQYV